MSPCSLTSSSAGPPPCNVFRGQRGIVPATRPVFAHDRHRRRRRMSMHLFLKAHLAGSFPQAGCSYILCRPFPPLPRLRQGIPGYLAGLPHPSRACGAPPPPPSGGGVRAWRYQVSSRIRLFSRISPCTGPWGYRHWGWGRRGGGTRSPSPVSHTPTILLLAGIPCPRLLPVKHTLSAGTPAPPIPG